MFRLFNKKLSSILVFSFVFLCFTEISYAQYFQGNDIGSYIKSIYTYAIGVVGIVATVVIMISGLVWISSMGNAQRVSTAREWMVSALMGLALALLSFSILYFINPDLVQFKSLDLTTIQAGNIQNTTANSPLNYNHECKSNPDCSQGYSCQQSSKTCQLNYRYVEIPEGEIVSSPNCTMHCKDAGYRRANVASAEDRLCRCSFLNP